MRLALGLVFVYAGVVKLLDVQAFARVISQYNLVPEAWLTVAALGLPALEVLAGLGLLLEVRGSLSAVTCLLLLFAGVLWFGVLQGLQIDCGCFSPAELAEQTGLRQGLYRDLLLLAAALYLYLWRWRRHSRQTARGWRWNSNLAEAKE